MFPFCLLNSDGRATVVLSAGAKIVLILASTLGWIKAVGAFSDMLS